MTTTKVKRIELEVGQWGEAERLVDKYLDRAGDDAIAEVHFKDKDGVKLGYRAGNEKAIFPTEVDRAVARVKEKVMRPARSREHLLETRAADEPEPEPTPAPAPAPELTSEQLPDPNPWATDL